MVRRSNPRAKDTRHTDEVRALQFAHSDMLPEDSAPLNGDAHDSDAIDWKLELGRYKLKQAGVDLASYARRKSVMNRDSFWPETPDMDRDWDKAVVAVEYSAATRIAMEKFIGRKAEQKRRPNKDGIRPLNREFGKSGCGRKLHMAKKTVARKEAAYYLAPHATRLKK